MLKSRPRHLSALFSLVVKIDSLDDAACAIKLKSDHPEIIRAYLLQDNVDSYHCANTFFACRTRSTWIRVARLTFSDSWSCKEVADRLATAYESHIRRYPSEGHNVTTAEEMKETLSYRGVTGLRVAVLPSINETESWYKQLNKGV